MPLISDVIHQAYNYVWDPNTLSWVAHEGAAGTGTAVNVTNASLAVTGPLTDSQLRASAVPVSGPFLTDTELRASAVPISGNVGQTGAPWSANPTTYFGKTLTYVMVNQGAAGQTILATSIGGQKHKIIGAVLTMTAAGTLKFEGSATIIGPLDIAGNGGFVLPPSLIPWAQTNAAENLSLTTTASTAHGVVIILTEA